VDWRIFHGLNHQLAGQPTAQDAVRNFNSYAIFVLAASAVVLWLLARPGGSPTLKLATAGAAASAVLAIIANVVLGKIWYQDRPFVDHPSQTVLVSHHAADNAFPSDHASVAFAIAFAVLLVTWRVGIWFMLFALAIGFGRIFEGVHYPSDILASFLVGLGSALVVVVLLRRPLEWAVAKLSRATDPVLALAWRRGA
jgi:membrane-associated phospholipid phosphatase